MSQLTVKLNTPELELLPESKARQIAEVFSGIAHQVNDFEVAHNELKSEIEESGITEETTQKARTLRLKIVKVRTTVDKIHKKQKEDILVAGRAIDSVKNVLKYGISGIEDNLKSIEKHYENIELERLKALNQKRIALIVKIDPESAAKDLSAMDEDVWAAYYDTKKRLYDERISEEKRLEAEEAKRKKEEAEEQARIKAENAKLKAEAEKKAKRYEEMSQYIVFIRDFEKMLNLSDSDYEKEFGDVRRAAAEHYEFERQEAAKIEAEKEAAKKLQAERAKKLVPYNINAFSMDLHSMNTLEFDAFYLQEKETFEEAKRKEEAEQKEKARLKKLNDDRFEIIKEYDPSARFIDLSKMVYEEWEEYYKAKKQAFLDEQQRIKDAEEAKKRAVEAAEALRIKEENDLLEKERIEAEEQTKLNASDDEKVISLIADIEALKTKYKFKSKKNKEIMNIIESLLDKVLVTLMDKKGGEA